MTGIQLLSRIDSSARPLASSQPYACLKGKEEKAIVKLLMLETETDEELGASGVLLFEWIDKEGSESAFGKDEKLKAAFDAKPFLRGVTKSPLV